MQGARGTLDHRVLRGGVRLYASPDGELKVWSPRAAVIASRFTGRLTLPLAQAVAAYSDERFAATRPDVRYRGFHDWAGMTAYDSDARRSLMAWTLSVRDRIDALHFLVGSRLVHMALTVGNLTLSLSIQSYTERAPFERAFTSAVGP